MSRNKSEEIRERDKQTCNLLRNNELSLGQFWQKYIASVDSGSKTYEERGSHYRLQVEKKLFLKEVSPARDELVLDGGCGTGHYLPDLLECGVKVAGCDLSIGCLRVCRERCAEASSGQLHLFRANVRDLPFASETFDRVVCRHVLQHVPLVSERLRVLQEFHRALKPGGWLHIITYNRTVRHLLTGRKEGIVAKRWYYYLYSVHELTSDIRSVFARRPKVRGVANTLPLLPRLGSIGVRIDQRLSLLPLVSCLNSYVLFASVRK